jgi:hypothetical protein
MVNNRSENDDIEVNYSYKLTDEKGKIIKRVVKSKLIINLYDVKVVDYSFDNKGELELKKCKIFHDPLGWMTLDETYNDFYNMKFINCKPGNIIGFETKRQARERLKSKSIKKTK